MVAPSPNSSFFKEVFTTDFFDLKEDGNASSAVEVITFKLENFDLEYLAWHCVHSISEPETVLGLSSKLPQSRQNIRDPTTDIFLDPVLLALSAAARSIAKRDQHHLKN